MVGPRGHRRGHCPRVGVVLVGGFVHRRRRHWQLQLAGANVDRHHCRCFPPGCWTTSGRASAGQGRDQEKEVRHAAGQGRRQHREERLPGGAQRVARDCDRYVFDRRGKSGSVLGEGALPGRRDVRTQHNAPGHAVHGRPGWQISEAVSCREKGTLAPSLAGHCLTRR